MLSVLPVFTPRPAAAAPQPAAVQQSASARNAGSNASASPPQQSQRKAAPPPSAGVSEGPNAAMGAETRARYYVAEEKSESDAKPSPSMFERASGLKLDPTRPEQVKYFSAKEAAAKAATGVGHAANDGAAEAVQSAIQRGEAAQARQDAVRSYRLAQAFGAPAE